MKEKRIRTLFAWSGGKDSSMALWKLQQDSQIEIVGLLTTGNAETQRISMHGVRLELARKQAESIGLPLFEVLVEDATYEGYEQKMAEMLQKCIAENQIEAVAFGDIFLEDLRKYREDKMTLLNLKALFPLWKQDTKMLAEEFLDSGFRTILCCINDGQLSADFAGKELTKVLIAQFPGTVDPCGENGEYHTFCFAGPIFRKPVEFKTGEKIYKPLEEKYISAESATKGFWYVDLEEFEEN